MPPGNVIASSVNEYAITVSWFHIQNGSVNGILQGYKVFYRNVYEDGNYSTITVGPLSLQAVISGSLSYRYLYEIRVAGFTRAGVGKESEIELIPPGNVASRTIFTEALHPWATRGGTKIWAKIISAHTKKCSGKEGFRHQGVVGGAKLQVLSSPLGHERKQA